MFEKRTAGAAASVNCAVLHPKQGELILSADALAGNTHANCGMGAEYGHGIMFAYANGPHASNSRPFPAAERAAFPTQYRPQRW